MPLLISYKTHLSTFFVSQLNLSTMQQQRNMLYILWCPLWQQQKSPMIFFYVFICLQTVSRNNECLAWSCFPVSRSLAQTCLFYGTHGTCNTSYALLFCKKMYNNKYSIHPCQPKLFLSVPCSIDECVVGTKYSQKDLAGSGSSTFWRYC